MKHPNEVKLFRGTCLTSVGRLSVTGVVLTEDTAATVTRDPIRNGYDKLYYIPDGPHQGFWQPAPSRIYADGDVVPESMRCPQCGERRADWLYIDGDLVDCQNCGAAYDVTPYGTVLLHQGDFDRDD